ncbi:MAG: hypothetical protein ACK53Q_15660, partial [Dolichospermum sp.]
GYTMNIIIRQNDIVQDWIQEAIYLTVENGDFYGTGKINPTSHGGVLFEQSWSINDSISEFKAVIEQEDD